MPLAVFQVYAPRYARCGLKTIPVDRDKKPLIKNWPAVQIETHRRLPPRFNEANVAVLDGTFGGITRVDVDDPVLAQECLDRFGQTPVVIGTPSGGFHLCYRASGEARQLKLDGKRIDILGSGGFGLMPPSETDVGKYEFLEGSIEHLRGDLPTIQGLEIPQGVPLRLSGLREGDGRNILLFMALKERAVACASDLEIQFVAEALNNEFGQPMSEREVSKVVKSVCRYKAEDRLMIKGCEATVVIPRSIFEQVFEHPAELVLYTALRLEHGARKGKPFVLAQATAIKYGMSVPTMRTAERGLEDKGLLECVKRGEQGKRHKTVVRFP